MATRHLADSFLANRSWQLALGNWDSTLRPQQTIANPATVSGFGYWSGKDITVEFRPAATDTGVVFVRRDLDPQLPIPVSVAHRIETPRRTTLVVQNAMVEMVEHLLAACAGLQIDNCEVWVDQSEMPGFDGSSQAFVTTLQQAGVVEQSAKRSQLIVTEVTRVSDGEAWVEARPTRTSGLSIKYQLEYSQPAIGRQTYRGTVIPETFLTELAPARTFVLEEEARWLQSQGLGERVRCQDLLVFGPDGPIDNELRFEDECVRHKALDLVGDLALAGCDLIGHVVAYRSGHRLNAELVRALLAEGQVVTERRKSA